MTEHLRAYNSLWQVRSDSWCRLEEAAAQLALAESHVHSAPPARRPRLAVAIASSRLALARRSGQFTAVMDHVNLLDASMASSGPHLRDIITAERRLTAARVCDLLPGMRLLVVATVTADGRPLAGPVDGYFLHGCFSFSSGRDSVRMRHLAARPAVSATHLPGEELAVTVHGRAELFELNGPGGRELRQAMLDHYLPRQGPSFQAIAAFITRSTSAGRLMRQALMP